MNASILIKDTLCALAVLLWKKVNMDCEGIRMNEIKEVDALDKLLVIIQMSVALFIRKWQKNFYVDLFTSLKSWL